MTGIGSRFRGVHWLPGREQTAGVGQRETQPRGSGETSRQGSGAAHTEMTEERLVLGMFGRQSSGLAATVGGGGESRIQDLGPSPRVRGGANGRDWRTNKEAEFHFKQVRLRRTLAI